MPACPSSSSFTAMETPKPYISINCWKCKAQNNAAVAIDCRVCGAYLAAAEENENPLSHGFADHPAFKGYLLIAVAVLAISVALIYFYRPQPIYPRRRFPKR